jgi:hypothetical protein
MLSVKLIVAAVVLIVGYTAPARGQTPEPEAQPAAAPDENPGSDGYTPLASKPELVVSGYIDVGFADAGGDGTSFALDDSRVPADYGVDAFAPAINSRGEVASTDAGGRLTGGFLPRSAGTGGRPSFLLNTVNFDARYEGQRVPVMLFTRVQLLPRFGERGTETLLTLDQAFGRLTPFESHDLMLSVGKFDSAFGVESLQNQATARTGITPSLLARYTTGTPVGAKLFYRYQSAPLWSAVSANVAVTNAPPFVEALQPPEISLTGSLVGSGRLSWELNLPRLQCTLGGSAMVGPRNDQGDPDVSQRALGADARLSFWGLTLIGEYVDVDQDESATADKRTGQGAQTSIVSGFHARGFTVLGVYELPLYWGPLRKVALYARFGQHQAWFDSHASFTVQRLTGGVRLDFWDMLALKGEYLANQEIAGAPGVDNDVVAASAVYSF